VGATTSTSFFAADIRTFLVPFAAVLPTGVIMLISVTVINVPRFVGRVNERLFAVQFDEELRMRVDKRFNSL
jgi:hypothetical protein